MANVITISNATQTTNFLGAIRRLYPVTQASGGSQGTVTIDLGRTVAGHTAGSTVFQGAGRSVITDKPVYYFSMVNGGTSWVEAVEETEIKDVHWTSADTVGLGICSGTCKDDAASALNGATVTITKGAVTKTATSAAGVYSIADIPADSGYTLTVAKTGYTTASYTVEITENATTTQNIVAARNGSMSGTVTEEGPGNVEGCIVEVCAIDTTTPVLYTAETIADGTYAIASVAVGTYDVWFRKVATHVSGKADDQAVVANTAKTVDHVLVQLGAMAGTVTSVGPVNQEGVVVNLYSAYPGTPAYTATTAANGTYAIANIQPGTYQIRFSKALYDNAFQHDYVVAGDGDYTVNQLIVLTA